MEKRDTPGHLGETRFALARALSQRPTDRQRARSLAVQARADYLQVRNATDEVARIDRWLEMPATVGTR